MGEEGAALVPAGTCDAHVHVFGDPASYPMGPAPAYAPPADATIGSLRRLHRALGIERAVIVQAIVYGRDHRLLRDLLRSDPGAYRGVALLYPDSDPAELEALRELGIRGARLTLATGQDSGWTRSSLPDAGRRARELGWHLDLHLDPEFLLAHERELAALPVPVVIDHLANVPAAGGTRQPAFRRLLAMAADLGWWVKISGADRIAGPAGPWDQAARLIAEVLATVPERVLWGSDWPHTEYDRPPRTADLFGFMLRCLPGQAERRRVLVDNPARLYGWPPA